MIINTAELSPEAQYYAYEAVEGIEQSLHEPPAKTGFRAQDTCEEFLFDLDHKIHDKLVGTDYVYLGHRFDLTRAMYHALLAGYNPTPDQLSKDDGWNFLWDEATDPNQMHSDVMERLGYFGYSRSASDRMPVQPTFCGAFVIPRPVLRNVIGNLHQRGQDYRQIGWGFPNWSEEVEYSEAIK